jgi:hypothetical protein
MARSIAQADSESEISVSAERYGQSVDLRDSEAWRAVWTQDGVMKLQDHGITGEAHWALASGAGSRDNPFVEPAKIAFLGRYVDRLRHVGGAWRIARRKVITDWIDTEINDNVKVGHSTSSVSEAAS